jgi:hypothetical protein
LRWCFAASVAAVVSWRWRFSGDILFQRTVLRWCILGLYFFNYKVVLHTMSPTPSPNQEPAVPQRPHDTALTLAHPYDFSEEYFNKAYRQNITRRKHNIARTSPRKHPSEKIQPTKSRQQKNTTPSQTCHAKKRDVQRHHGTPRRSGARAVCSGVGVVGGGAGLGGDGGSGFIMVAKKNVSVDDNVPTENWK